jgi:hypothetical protein
MSINFTTAQYAARLEEMVLEQLALEPSRYGGVASWEALHDVCDANEFVLECDESFGYSFPAAADEPAEWDAYIAIVDAAIAVVEQRIFPLAA